MGAQENFLARKRTKAQWGNYDKDLSRPPINRIPRVASRRNRASARRSLELLIIKLPPGGKTQARIAAAIAVAISPLSNPSSLEIAKTAKSSSRTAASFPMPNRWQKAAIRRSAIEDSRVPGIDRSLKKREPSPENTALTVSRKKVPQTPRRQPATKPTVKPPITIPPVEKLTRL